MYLPLRILCWVTQAFFCGLVRWFFVGYAKALPCGRVRGRGVEDVEVSAIDQFPTGAGSC